MFKGLVRKDGLVYLRINDEMIECARKYQSVLNEKLDTCPKKVTKVFGDVMNNRMNTQDIVDYNMDEDITWQFIKIVISISNQIRKK
jgi:hypothetical protein